jgi:hypothetical protein
MSRQLHRITAACLLMAGTPAAFSQGLGAAPTFDKPQYFVNENATLAISGQGTCKNIEVDWGDGSKQVVPSFDFGAVSGQNKLNVTHKYAAAKSYFLSVKTIPGPTLAEQCGSRSASTVVVQAGKLTKVSASPASSTAGQPVDLIVEGDGVCPADAVIRVSPAAGGAAQTVGAVFAKNAPWPRKVSLVPAVAGTYIIGHSVAPGQNVAASVGCFSLPAGSDGKFTVQAAPAGPSVGLQPGAVVVAPPSRPVAAPAGGPSSPIDQTAGLEIMKPGSAPPCTPGVNQASPAALKPGDKLTLAGCFGLQLGKVRLKGAAGNTIVESLPVDAWSDTAIVANVPVDLTGLPDQGAYVEVTTAKNQVLKRDGMSFVATRETRTISMHEFDTKDVAHGLVHTVAAGPNTPFQGGVCQTSVCAQHKVHAVPSPPFFGNDHFQVKLINGWAYKSHNLTAENSGADVNFLNCPVPSGVGPKPSLTETNTGNPMSFKVKNGFTGCLSWTAYRLNVQITGPKGVPFR